jgi:predicted DNA-binding transcriptional regulator YafY
MSHKIGSFRVLGTEMKEESAQTLARQWAMLRALPRAPIKATTGEIADKLANEGFEVSRRTIERDLHSLAGLFPLFVDDRAKPYGWCWARDANFEFMPRLTSSQAVTLLLAQSHLHHLLPIGMRKDLLPVFEAAAQTLVNSGWKDWHKCTAVISMTLALIPPKVDLKVLDCVQTALARRRCISGQYRTKGSVNPKEIAINPLGLLVRGSALYLVCTLFEYADVRQLALHRLANLAVLPKASRSPAGFDFRTYAAAEGAHLLSRGSIRLVCCFDVSAAEHLVESPLAPDQTWKLVDNGLRAEVTATVENDERLRWWLMGFGSQAEVLAPASLRAELRDEYAAGLACYSA